MPEVLFRMKLATMVTLKELELMFNKIANAIIKGKTESTDMGVVAQLMFPQYFVQPKDEYMVRMLAEIAESKSIELGLDQSDF